MLKALSKGHLKNHVFIEKGVLCVSHLVQYKTACLFTRILSARVSLFKKLLMIPTQCILLQSMYS